VYLPRPDPLVDHLVGAEQEMRRGSEPHSGFEHEIVWTKLKSLAEDAWIASRALWA
jgi:hypothetical protein